MGTRFWGGYGFGVPSTFTINLIVTPHNPLLAMPRNVFSSDTGGDNFVYSVHAWSPVSVWDMAPIDDGILAVHRVGNLSTKSVPHTAVVRSRALWLCGAGAVSAYALGGAPPRLLATLQTSPHANSFEQWGLYPFGDPVWGGIGEGYAFVNDATGRLLVVYLQLSSEHLSRAPEAIWPAGPVMMMTVFLLLLGTGVGMVMFCRVKLCSTNSSVFCGNRGHMVLATVTDDDEPSPNNNLKPK